MAIKGNIPHFGKTIDQLFQGPEGTRAAVNNAVNTLAAHITVPPRTLQENLTRAAEGNVDPLYVDPKRPADVERAVFSLIAQSEFPVASPPTPQKAAQGGYRECLDESEKSFAPFGGEGWKR